MEVSKPKRKYTKIGSRVNKTKTISLRLTEEEYNDLLRKAEYYRSASVSDFILRMLRGVK